MDAVGPSQRQPVAGQATWAAGQHRSEPQLRFAKHSSLWLAGGGEFQAQPTLGHQSERGRDSCDGIIGIFRPLRCSRPT